MNRFWKIANKIVLAFLVISSLAGTFYKHISFGRGIGDIIGYFALYFTTVVHFAFTFRSKNKGATRHIYLTLIFGVIAVFITLKATLWRGPEYAWDGTIFYMPCKQTMVVDNEDVQKKMTVSMCSGQYYSDFKARWAGSLMKLETGNIKTPSKLKKYISFPIDSIIITPDSYSFIENGITQSHYYFLVDTLKQDKSYSIVGEIYKVDKTKPVLRVRLK